MVVKDISAIPTASKKMAVLKSEPLATMLQSRQIENPDSRVVSSLNEGDTFLSKYADCYAGLLTGDSSRFYKYFWEIADLGIDWEYLQGTVRETVDFGGREQVIFWQKSKGELYKLAESLKHLNHVVQNWRRGQDVWGKKGVSVSQIGGLPVTLYLGDRYDCNNAAIVPKNPEHFPAIWMFCSSPEFNLLVRNIDQALKVTNRTLLKVPFDLSYWQQIADEQYPNGLPEPHSDDPTQWLFDGEPAYSTAPLQVAVARLLGYRWTQQDARDQMDDYADRDGIVCLPPLAGEKPAHERLRQLLAAAYTHFWAATVQDKLLQEVGYGGQDLEAWLRDGFFEQHCKLFQNRPFIWHIWDGRKDGFAALVNYHKLDHTLLNRLIYTYLGDWIRRQRADRDAGLAGADGRLVAALELQQKLEAIQLGEPPYDIYVRWKPLHEQPIGWNPDLNDGVRLNIRPFVEAGILRRKFTVHWKKDRGKNPDGSERHNDLHYTRLEKEAARKEMAS